MRWIRRELSLPGSLAGSPSSPTSLGREVLRPRLTARFVTLTRYLIVCHKRLHTYPGGVAKVQILRRLRLFVRRLRLYREKFLSVEKTSEQQHQKYRPLHFLRKVPHNMLPTTVRLPS